MTPTDLFSRFHAFGSREALVARDQTHTYAELERRRREWVTRLSPFFRNGTAPVIGLQADYSPESIACLFAIWSLRGTAALIPPSPTDEAQILADTQVTLLFRQPQNRPWQLEHIGHQPSHVLLRQLMNENAPGLILLTTGSSGRPKAVLHHTERFLEKFQPVKTPYRTLAFLLYDHIAGLDTLLSVLSSGGVVIVPQKRDPASICRLIEDHRIEVLPTSPTFLRLLCLSGALSRFDLSSLKIITYGSEPMTPATLAAIRERFPKVRLIQKYGSTEFGSPPSSTRPDDGLWLKLDGKSARMKVIDRMLWIKTETTMMGYLNAPTPRVQDGWFPTGDEVIVDGEWIRILGRKSEVIRVGGEKIHPVEVEAVISELPNIGDVVVTGEAHPILGQIVVATVSASDQAQGTLTVKDILAHCRKRLAAYKVPMKVHITGQLPSAYRQKKIRSPRPSLPPSSTIREEAPLDENVLQSERVIHQNSDCKAAPTDDE